MARLLVERGYDVTAMDLGPCDELPIEVNFRSLDLRDPQALASIAQKWDGVVHLAGASVPSLFSGPAPVLLNLEITLNLLNHLRDSRVLLVSSCHVYAPSRERRAEFDPIVPQGLYGLSKHLVEQLASHYRGRLDVRVARPFNHLGPGLRPELMLPSLLRRLSVLSADDKTPLLMEGLNSTRDFIDVRDVVSAYLSILEMEPVANPTFNVCTGTGHTIEQVVVTAMTLMNRVRPVQFRGKPNSSDDINYLVGDPGRLASVTGWRAAFSLSDSLFSMINSHLCKGPA
jgi:GDP-4-dehydro-6-deoxy-D-mannose reductase